MKGELFMGFFKEINCANCGEETSFLTRTKIANGEEYLCSNCSSNVPKLFSKSLKVCSLDDYKYILEYMTGQEELKNKFNDTLTYHDFHVDTENKLFYVQRGLFEKPIYFKLENLSFIDFEFIPEEVKEGIFGDKVKGDVKITISIDKPCCFFEAKIATGVKAPAHKRFLQNKYDFEYPEKLTEFLEAFNLVYQAKNL